MSDKYDDPRAHQLREAYHAVFGGEELPVPVESIAEDLLGLAIEARELEVSGMLIPAERRILVRADEPDERRRFTIAHELGHWVCQCLEGTAQAVYCRAADLSHDVDRKIEREANIFATELLMPEAAVRAAWGTIVAQSDEDPPAAMAERLDVSPSAMGWRLFNLGLVAGKPA